MTRQVIGFEWASVEMNFRNIITETSQSLFSPVVIVVLVDRRCVPNAIVVALLAVAVVIVEDVTYCFSFNLKFVFQRILIDFSRNILILSRA